MGKVENEGMPVVRLDRQLKYQGNILKIKKTRSKLRLRAFRCLKHLPNFIYFYPER